MTKKVILLILVLFTAAFVAQLAFAQPANQDSTSERIAAERRAQDLLERGIAPHDRIRATTTEERKYDKSVDGWLQPSEAKKMLEDRASPKFGTYKTKADKEPKEKYDPYGTDEADEGSATKYDRYGNEVTGADEPPAPDESL